MFAREPHGSEGAHVSNCALVTTVPVVVHGSVPEPAELGAANGERSELLSRGIRPRCCSRGWRRPSPRAGRPRSCGSTSSDVTLNSMVVSSGNHQLVGLEAAEGRVAVGELPLLADDLDGQDRLRRSASRSGSSPRRRPPRRVARARRCRTRPGTSTITVVVTIQPTWMPRWPRAAGPPTGSGPPPRRAPDDDGVDACRSTPPSRTGNAMTNRTLKSNCCPLPRRRSWSRAGCGARRGSRRAGRRIAQSTTQTAISRHQWWVSSWLPAASESGGRLADPAAAGVGHAATFMKPPMYPRVDMGPPLP